MAGCEIERDQRRWEAKRASPPATSPVNVSSLQATGCHTGFKGMYSKWSQSHP